MVAPNPQFSADLQPNGPAANGFILMHYYGFRYYDPGTGRWPNRDPIGERGSALLRSLAETGGDITKSFLFSEFLQRNAIAINAFNRIRTGAGSSPKDILNKITEFAVAAKNLSDSVKAIQLYESSTGFKINEQFDYLPYNFAGNNSINEIDKLGLIFSWKSVVGTGMTAAAAMIAIGVGGVSAPLWVPIALGAAGVGLIICDAAFDEDELNEGIQNQFENDNPGSIRNSELWDDIYGYDFNDTPYSFENEFNQDYGDIGISFEGNNNSVGLEINFYF